MVGGYAGKILNINLSHEKITETRIENEILRQYVGGRGLGARILWDHLGSRWEKVDPLGPENLFMALTGPLTGYFHGARICVTGKSPQSNGIIGSTVSGEFAIELKCSGWDGVIVSGKAEKPVYILIDNEEVQIKSAKHVWQKDSKTTLKILTKEVKEELDNRYKKFGIQKEPGILYTGTAGDNQVRAACVLQKWSHAAGYGGVWRCHGFQKLEGNSRKGEWTASFGFRS
jgi:aldehyde:ferredoxin oxidoreductase